MAVKLGVKCVRFPLNRREAAVCLALAKGKVTTQDIAGLTGYHVRSVQRALRALRERGIVKVNISYEGRGKFTMWCPVNLDAFRRTVRPEAQKIVGNLLKNKELQTTRD